MKIRKLLISILTGLCVVLSGATLLTACKDDHTHAYTAKTTTEATCTEKGVVTYTCSCNDTYTEEIPATGNHAWDNGEVTTEPTCTEKGVKIFTCTVCETATYTEDVSALGHDTKIHEAQAPTCNEKGWEAYETCTRCEYTTYVEIPATNNHVWDGGEVTTAPTCTEMGVKMFTCITCQTATYTENINALTHDISVHNPKDPTCADAGWAAYADCKREGCNYTTYEEIPATGNHTWDNGELTVAPTCTESGIKTFTCTTCKTATYTEYVNALIHDIKVYNPKSPTCVEVGWEAYAACIREGCTYTTYQEIPAIGHEVETHQAQIATCTEKGWNAYETCSRCDYTTYEEISALDHDRVTHEAQEPTCAEIGWNAYETCSRCEYTTYEEIPVTSVHTWDEGVITTNPTCTEVGVKTFTCIVCKTATKTESIATLPHEYAEAWSSDATYHWHECKCGDKIIIEKHTPSAPATETTKQICTVCGYVIQNELVLTTLTFNGNGATSGEMSNITAYNTETIVIPKCQYERTGYLFIGWATVASGEAVFREGEPYIMDGDSINTLYAVWLKGMTDMFGSDDLLYLLDEDAEEIYLLRGGVYFQGEYYSKYKEFAFFDVNDNIVLTGKILSENTYVYYDSWRNGSCSVLYETGVGLNENVRIDFDAFNGIKYVEEGEDGKTSTSEGTYTITEEGYYVITFTEGIKAGEMMTIQLGTVGTSDGGESSAFQIRNEKDIELGTLVRFEVTDDGTLGYYPTAYDVTLNGFGVALHNNGTSYDSYYYVWNEDGTITLQNTNGQSIGVLCLMEELGMKGYMFYTETQDKTYEAANGATLTLDGVCKAVYTNGSTTLTGYYTTSTSVFGGIIVKMTANGTLYTFLITETTTEVSKEVTNEAGEAETVTETVVTYELFAKNNGYAEYYYQDATGAYYAPMMVVEDPAAGKATLYGYTAEKKYLKVSVGSYVYNEESGLYVYTAEEYFEAPDVFTDPIDLATIKSFVFNLDSTTTQYSVNYWYSSETNDGVITDYAEYYSSKGAKLTLVGGFAIYAADGYVLTGTYKMKDNLMQISTNSGYLYLEFVDEDTFITLDTAPYSAYVLLANGDASKTEYMEFDGKGGATYVVVTPAENEGEEDVYTRYVGKVTQVGQTAFGVDTYMFASTGKTFLFLSRYSDDNEVYICIFDMDWQGSFETSAGILTLDGYGYQASLNDKEGSYFFNEEDVLIFTTTDGEAFAFEKVDGQLNALGVEYGKYQFVDNGYEYSTWLKLDGKKGLTIYMEQPDGSICEGKGTYTFKNNECVISYSIGESYRYEYTGILEGDKFFVKYSDGFTLVNPTDNSVLVLDSYNNATKYNDKGFKTTGIYTFVTSDLLYFKSDDGDDCGLYEYDREAGRFYPLELYDIMYFTEELDGLIFYSQGYAVFHGKDEYFYNVDYEGRVMIYRQAEAGETANQYGFHEIDFGRFDGEKAYEGLRYYMLEGWFIEFNRDPATAHEYPLEYGAISDLIFCPPGTVEFTVKGTVEINDVTYMCYVTREILEDGTVSMYVTIGSYRVDIVVNYEGEDENGNSKNTYEVVGMQYIVSVLSYTYMDLYYTYYSILGSYASMFVTNQLGSIALTTTYNEAGEEVETYFTSNFGAESGFVDLNGNLIQIDKAEYESSDSGLYTVSVEAEDGYTYNFYFMLRVHSAFGSYGFINYAFTRHQSFVTNNYTVNVERVIATEYDGYEVGGIYSIALTKDGVSIPTTEVYIMNNKVYCVERGEDGNATYYVLTFEGGELVGELIAFYTLYTSVDIEEMEIRTVYADDGESFVDIDEAENTIKLLRWGSTTIIVETCEYDAYYGIYTVTTHYGDVYTVEIENDKAVIEGYWS